MIAPASRKIGQFEILQKLGRGGMADVYLAQDTVSGGHLALKLIEHSADADTRDSIEAERRGAELQESLAAIDSRVVKIYGFGDLENYFYVAMEYIDGQDLAEWLRAGSVIPEFAADTAMAVAETLDHAHSLEVTIEGKDFHGIIHGDIKPKNIRIDSHGEVRVLDFGIAKALSLSRKLTRNEFGSVPYASPERLDSGEVNIASDLWSLAVMLYEMVTGLQPYGAENTERLERMIRSRIPPPPAPDPCPEALRRILIKALAPEPEVRYQSAHDFLTDLRAFRAGEPVRAVSEDLDATRRTFRRDPEGETRRTASAAALEAGDETRRTVPQADSEDSQAALMWPPASKLRVYPPAVKRGFMAVLLGLLLYVCIWAGSGYLTYRRGQELARDIETEQATDVNQIWNKWAELSGNNPSSMLLYGPRKAVMQKLLVAVDHVIEGYRNGDVVPESQWKLARDMSAHALSLDPDNRIRGKLRIAEGHLARLNGINRRNAADFMQAVEKFNDAQRLMPDSVDPQLGLARIYLTGIKDLDKANDSLQQAARKGYVLSKPERARLAEGYRERADNLFWDSRNVRGQEQEKTQIEHARDDYQRALELYQSIVPFNDASSRIVRIQKSLESVNFRLDEIKNGSGLSGFLRRLWR